MQNNKKLNFTAVLICTLASLFYLYDFLLRVMPSAMTNDLMGYFHIGAAKLGIMLAIFYYAYAPMQIPAGLLFDRIGTRLLLTIMVVICSFGTLIFGITDSTVVAATGRFLIGISSAFAFLGALVLAARWLPPKYFAFFVGLVQLLGCVGAIVGEKPIAVAVKHFGWQTTNFVAAIIGFILAVLFWVLLRDHPEGATAEEKKKTDIKIFKQLAIVFKNRQNLWIGFYAFLIWAPASIFAALWGVPFLMSLYNINASLASGVISLVWVGIGIGGPLSGWWSDRLRKRCLPLNLLALLGAVATFILLYIDNIPMFLMCGLLFLLGVGISGMVVTFGVIQDINSSKTLGAANGFNNMAILIGGVVLQPLVGVVLHALWGGKIVNHIPVYSLNDYKIALTVLPVCFLLALFTSVFFVKETCCESS